MTRICTIGVAQFDPMTNADTRTQALARASALHEGDALMHQTTATRTSHVG
jgi:hypothetical protein